MKKQLVRLQHERTHTERRRRDSFLGAARALPSLC